MERVNQTPDAYLTLSFFSGYDRSCPGMASKISKWPTAFLFLSPLPLLAMASSLDNRASLSRAIPVTSSDSIIFAEEEEEATEAIEATVGNGGNFGGCKVALTVVVLSTPWWFWLLLSVNVILSEDEAAEAEILQG